MKCAAGGADGERFDRLSQSAINPPRRWCGMDAPARRQVLPRTPAWAGMRAMVGAALFLLLAGCAAGGGSDKYFPPQAELPDGIHPVATDSPEWKLVAPLMGMQSNPGHLGALDRLPQKDLGKVESVDAYLLQGNGTESYGVLALRFANTDDIGPTLAQGEAHACDGKDMAHVLKDGLTYVFVGGDGSTAHGKTVLDQLADTIALRSGASQLC